HTAGYFKDGINDYVVLGNKDAVNPAHEGTKVALHYQVELAGGASMKFRLRLANETIAAPAAFATVMVDRRSEADAFYAAVQVGLSSEDERTVQRQAFAGLLWSKQYYGLDVRQWLRGDPLQPAPPAERRHGRNVDWTHLYNATVMSMPDKWEYPWYAAWDLAFHCVTIAVVDPQFAKEQLILLTREWYMH